MSTFQAQIFIDDRGVKTFCGALMEDLVKHQVENCTTVDGARVIVTLYDYNKLGCDPQLISLFEELVGNFKQGENKQILSILTEIPNARSAVYDLSMRFAKQSDEYVELIEYLLCVENSIPHSVVEFLYSQVFAFGDSNSKSASRALLSTQYTPPHNWWSLVSVGLSDPRTDHLAIYRTWLSATTCMDEFLDKEEYWMLLRQGIVAQPRSTERIKYCLQILQASLKSLGKLSHLWTRYIAMVEIVSVDVSQNQADEGRQVITQLCSQLPPTWALTILQTGLTSTAENMRALILDIIFKLPGFELFNGDPRVVVEFLIPVATDSAKFTTIDQTECPYIDKLSALIRSIIVDLNPENQVVFVNELIQNYTKNSYGFEPPRVVILNAIHQGIASRILEYDTLTQVSLYANTALRVCKSGALGYLIYVQCAKLWLDRGVVDTKQWLCLFDEFFQSEATFEFLCTIEIPQEAAKLMQREVTKKASYALALNDYKENDEADQVINFRGKTKSLEPSMKKIAFAQIQQGQMKESTRQALNSCDTKSWAFPHACTKLGEMQVRSLDETAYLPNNDLLEILETPQSYASNDERLQHAYTLEYMFEQIRPTTDSWSSIIRAVTNAFRYTTTSLREAALRCLSRYLSLEVPVEELKPALEEIWTLLVEHSLRAVDRPLHIQFIELLTHEKVLQLDMQDLCKLIIDASYSRRNLLVPLARGLSKGESLWCLEVLTDLYSFIRTFHDVFYVEGILAEQNGVYTRFFGEPEVHARAVAIEKLAEGHHAHQVSDHVLKNDSFSLLDITKRHDGAEEIKRVLGYQILILQSRFWKAEYWAHIVTVLEEAVDVESSKICRVYIEWLLALSPNPQRSILSVLNQKCEPRFTSSYGRVGLLYGRNTMDMKFFEEYVRALIPLCTTNKAAVRHFSVALVVAIANDKSIKVEQGLHAIVDRVAEISMASSQLQHLWTAQGAGWDMKNDLTLTGVCGGVCKSLGMSRSVYTLSLKAFEDALGPGDYGKDYAPQPRSITSVITEVTTIRDGLDAIDNIQTKSGAVVERSELIVVASLVDMGVNLGGICRLCNALGAKLMTIHDMKVVKSREFKSTTVTAERWMPMEQVEPEQIASYMKKCKQEGYTLVGLEQTDDSRILTPQLEFPRKTLLLIGREREGIPGNLLGLLDFCVEIEQFGIVRSMNVQTATSVIVNAYNHQHV